ncbi:hypothetical protein [Ornithinibacillus halotolerans]|uniref:Uncharacterized protein n=1 Tax=Ornithinibacillus halotolerans TaxID=1274357 RepID=A0A916RWP3_9BACI|nr:hypothetical protein [Ornithinibacillus halotolerans]GGA74641.1 hypothetical protein GCM10008025_17980 [Ornithinibacillus halotolerans]
MRQVKYGLLLYLFLMLPPVIHVSESIMVIHMHMQMPLLVIVGILITPFLKSRFPNFFSTWNKNGIPGMLLFLIIVIYWMIPRTMDEAITVTEIEIFKFISLPFLAGVPLRDSWNKLTKRGKNIILTCLSVIYVIVGGLYVFSPAQLCNNYLVAEQKALGWTSVFTALGIIVFLIQSLFIHEDEFEEADTV